jgi:hypothetical protein
MISRIGANFKNHPGQKRIYNYKAAGQERKRGKTPTASISYEKEDK